MKTKGIDLVGKITSEEFNTKYFKPQKPVIIKGLANEYPAGKKWTMEYIKEICGDVMVDVYDNSNPNQGSAYTSADLKMRFGEYAETLLENKPSSLRLFLFNMFKFKPELRKDFPCPEIFRGILGRVGFMFFGAKDIKVRIHQDMDFSNVLLTHFHGRKKVVLVAPRYSRLLYKLPFNTHSLVDLDNPDYDKYPGLRYIEIYECLLSHGDSLFMPSGYWHYITYLDSGFSVSYRKIAHNINGIFQGFLSLCIYMPFDKVMNKLQGKKWLDKKEQIARMRANKAINNIKKEALVKENAINANLQPH